MAGNQKDSRYSTIPTAEDHCLPVWIPVSLPFESAVQGSQRRVTCRKLRENVAC